MATFRNLVAGSGILAIGAVAFFSGTPMHADTTPKPTFTKDIAPIFQQKCETCHRAEGMAPMSLVTYEDARPWLKSIAQRVSTHQMPPWNIDKTVGIQNFKNDRSLSDDQIATIAKWVASGAPKGDMPRTCPPRQKCARRPGLGDGSQVPGKPDLTVNSHAVDGARRGPGRLVAAGNSDGPHGSALGSRD